jgi:TetR/AcrR family transcriptional regulator, cholesterol catabolism regulator
MQPRNRTRPRNATAAAAGLSTRDRLSVEAARLFAERGYHGTSVNDLAVALGIQKSSLYAYISSKEDLLAGIALTGAAAFHSALDKVPENAAAGERLQLALRAHLGVVESKLDVATVWLQEWRYLTGDSRELFVKERRRYEERIRYLLEAAVEAGDLRADLDVTYSTLAFLSVANWAYTWFTPDTDVEQVTAKFLSILLHGIGSEDAPAKALDSS